MFRHERWICVQLVKRNHLATGPHTWLASQLLPCLLSTLWCAAGWQGGTDGREQEHCRTGRVSSWWDAIFTAAGCLCLGKEKLIPEFETRIIPVFQCLERESQSLWDFAAWGDRLGERLFSLVNLLQGKHVGYFKNGFSLGKTLFDLEFHYNFDHSLWHLVPI